MSEGKGTVEELFAEYRKHDEGPPAFLHNRILAEFFGRRKSIVDFFSRKWTLFAISGVAVAGVLIVGSRVSSRLEQLNIVSPEVTQDSEITELISEIEEEAGSTRVPTPPGSGVQGLEDIGDVGSEGISNQRGPASTTLFGNARRKTRGSGPRRGRSSTGLPTDDLHSLGDAANGTPTPEPSQTLAPSPGPSSSPSPEPSPGISPLAPLVVITPPAHEESLYVRAGAGGRGDGSDWDNAFTALPGTLIRGRTYYIADGVYPGYDFDDPEDGTSNITIKKATASDHGADTGWNSSYGQGQARFGDLSFSSGNYVLDGMTGGGPGSWDSGFGFLVQGEGHNIHLYGAISNLTFRHIDIRNLGRDRPNGLNNKSVYAIEGANNLTFSYCAFRDVAGGQFTTPGSSNITVEYSQLARSGSGAPAWSAKADSNITIRYNIFEDASSSAFIYLGNGRGTAANWDIYGNVFWHSGAYSDLSCGGIIYVEGTIDARGWNFHNNSIVGIKGGSAGLRVAGSDIHAYNNLWYGNRVNAIDFWSGCDHDYNWFYDNWRVDGTTPERLDLRSGEANAQIGNSSPFVSLPLRNFGLAEPTQSGKALSTPFDRDMFGVKRGEDRVFDRGAIELVR